VKPSVEIACFNIKDAIEASIAGADRIEFCSSYQDGGLSPDPSDLYQLLQQVKIPVVVMLRIRKGSFEYTDEEHKEHIKRLQSYLTLGAKEFVYGSLTSSHTINIHQLKDLLGYIKPSQLTFHRAVDQSKPYNQNVKILSELGIKRLLSSGAKDQAVLGLPKLLKIHQLYGSTMEIMPGGGIRSGLWNQVFKNRPFRSYHSACWNFESQSMDYEELYRFINCVHA